MDIRQAKEELRRMVLAYTERTEDGQLRIPMLHQRPALLMGPPGVGKTAILSQLADELHIGLVAYTMTTRARARSDCRSFGRSSTAERPAPRRSIP